MRARECLLQTARCTYYAASLQVCFRPSDRAPSRVRQKPFARSGRQAGPVQLTFLCQSMPQAAIDARFGEAALQQQPSLRMSGKGRKPREDG